MKSLRRPWFDLFTLFFVGVCLSGSCLQAQAPAAGSAQEQEALVYQGPDCENDDLNMAELAACYRGRLDFQKRAMAARVKLVVDQANQRGRVKLLEAFNKAQSSWREYMEAHCSVGALFYEGGSMAGLERITCETALYTERNRQIQDLLDLFSL